MFFKDLVGDVVTNTSRNFTQLQESENFHLSTKALVATSATNFVLLLVTTIIFSLLRRKFPRVYTPRRLLLSGSELFGKLPTNLIGWLYPAFQLNDSDILRLIGLDALMFLRYLRLCLKFGIVILPYGLIVALPVNYYGGIAERDSSSAGLDRLTMGNVEERSGKLWVHFFGVWLYTLVILFLLYREYVAYQGFRQTSLSNGSKYPHRYLVMLCDLPKRLNDQEKMKQYVDKCFPGQSLNVYVLEESKQWKKLIEKYEKAQKNHAASKAVYEKEGKRPRCHPKLLQFAGPKVDSISYFEEEIKNIKAELEEERKKPHKALDHSFVAYNSLKDAAIAGNGLAWDYYPDQLQARICPQKDDIVWGNLTKDRRIRFLVSLIMNTIVQFLMIFFWSIPVGIASTMVSFERLEQKIPFFKNVAEKLGPVATSFISGFLSTVVVVVFFAILPMILAVLAHIKGILTHSEIHNDVLEKLFVFKILNQFVIFILGNTMMQRLTEILDHPSEIPNAMAEAMPTAANFFINFIMLKATTIFGFELLRIVPLIIINIRRKFFVKSALDDKEAWAPPEMWFSEQYAEILLILLITISYSVLAPLVIPFGVLYFAFGYITWMNQLLFVYVPKWEGDGQMWPIIFNRTMVAIVVFLIFMMGLFSLKQYAIIATLTLPLLVICVLFWSNVNQMFTKQSASLTFSSCSKIRDLSPDLIEKTFTGYLQNHNIPEFGEEDVDEGFAVNEGGFDEDELLLSDKN